MKKFDPIQSWIDNVAYSHSKSENTEYQYRHGLQFFCDFIEKTPQQILEEYEGMTDREFRRKYARYVRALISHLSHEYAIGTVKLIVAAIKSFFKYNDLPLGHIPIGRNKVTFHNRDITKEEIVNILKISRPRDRGFFCMMTQTGLRPDTLCNLRLKHIEPEFSKGIMPCKVDVPEEMAKGEYGAYFTFMGKESVKHLKDYLKTRADMGPEDYLFTLHGKDKQLDRRSMSHIFRRAILKLKQKGLMDFEQKQKGKPSDLRLYNLRKFFRKRAPAAPEVSLDYVNFWMGHKTNYKAPHIPASDEHYFPREDVEFHREKYKKAMPFLRLETATPSETEQTITELREQVRELSGRIEKQALLLSERIPKVFAALEKNQKERLELKSKIAGIESLQKMLLEEPDEVILDFIKDIRRQLKDKTEQKKVGN